MSDHAAALWAQLQRRRTPTDLGRLLRKLEWTHRELARKDKDLPATASVQAYRRKCLEVLQSENAAAEALLARLVASTFELGALAERRGELSRKAIESATPVQSVWSWSGGPRVTEVTLVVCIIGVIACWRWPGLCVPLGVLLLILGQRARPNTADPGRTRGDT